MHGNLHLNEHMQACKDTPYAHTHSVKKLISLPFPSI